jgi:diguanylate cyclase (GGDEF)-like protein
VGNFFDFSSHSSLPLYYFLAGILLLMLFGSVFARRTRYTARGQVHLAQQNMLVSALADVQELAMLVDDKGIVSFINPASERLLKTKMRTARGKHFSQLFSLLDSQTRIPLTWFERVKANTNERLDIPQALLSAGGLSDLRVSCSVQMLQYEDHDAIYFMLLMRNQTELQELQVRMEYIGLHDSHTSLLNRKGFEIRLKIAIDQVRQHGVKHSFCLISMDQFKLINDSMGHSGGDELIKRVAQLLKESIDAKRDTLARLGGDEFGILLQEVEPAVAIQVVERIYKQLSQYNFDWNDMHQQITASIAFVPLYKALVTANNRNASVNRILSVADNACRVAKSKGGNRVHIYRPNDQEINKQRGNIVWLGRLKKAFEAGNFRLVAQPIHSLDPKEFKKSFHHYEVLIRLYDEKENPIPPDEFIPAAEYYSMMPRLDRWVVRKLLQSLRDITQRVPCPIFAVNLSGQSLDEPDFLQFVLEEIRIAGVSPGMVCFEITERVAIHNIELAQKFIETLKSLGCSFSLDDFGTGVSSFAYLKSLPVDYLKIDGSFIKDIANDEVAEAMVRSVNQVGHLMGVKVIAEYVENDQVMQIIREIGVDYGQGYGISKPIPLEDVIKRHVL